MVIIMLIGIALGTGCGPNMDPTPSTSTSAAAIGGLFVDVPAPGSVHPLNSENRTNNSVIQSFEVDGFDASATFDYYKTHLAAAGWTELEAGPSGGTDFRGMWKKDQVQLTVTTSPLRPAKSGSNCQLNLQRST